ncbi:MAG: DeoR/GlpR transcriptional regulator [Coprococcus sp.]|nr:DeoR/GlpR transcriptional regulator [Coprococcus sp.]
MFLGPGTTAYYIARELARRDNIHVLTNNLMAAGILAPNPGIQTIVIGGEIHASGVYTLPENIEKELDNIYLDKAFFSIDGAGIKSGYTLSDPYILDIIKTVCTKCEEFILAIDYTKYGKRAFMKLADMGFTHHVIMNENTPSKYRQYYANHDIKTYTLSMTGVQKDSET